MTYLCQQNIYTYAHDLFHLFCLNIRRCRDFSRFDHRIDFQRARIERFQAKVSPRWKTKRKGGKEERGDFGMNVSFFVLFV
jgi:hypothetical protein